jgi:hypothetical protein
MAGVGGTEQQQNGGAAGADAGSFSWQTIRVTPEEGTLQNRQRPYNRRSKAREFEGRAATALGAANRSDTAKYAT